jgi:hypothetical protein
MQQPENHLSDRDLLMAIDGELTPREAARAASHLEACWTCRSRRLELESAIADYVRLRHRQAALPSAEGPRALLKAQLAQRADACRSPVGPLSAAALRGLAWFAAVAAGLAVVWFAAGSARPRRWQAVAVATPDPRLTPGATVRRSREEVCRESNPNNKSVPADLRRKVFQEYGIRDAAPEFYEVDYLITPALGGADDIRNLWPQSYRGTAWNAQVKDALEDHLRQQVCLGNLDLATAQREIATNWIEAYKKYFHTDAPTPSP